MYVGVWNTRSTTDYGVLGCIYQLLRHNLVRDQFPHVYDANQEEGLYVSTIVNYLPYCQLGRQSFETF